MIILLDELRKHEFSLSDIKVIYQEPPYRELVQKSRICNGFLYVCNGSCRYTFEGGEFEVEAGGIIYLPFGSRHVMNVTSKEISFYRVDFTLYVGGEVALFSDKPLKITDHVPRDCIEAIKELEGNYGIGEDSVARMQRLCTVFSCLQKDPATPNEKRLMPAVRYLQENAVIGVNCAELADLCFMSRSRFYDLFNSEFGMSPIEYRDRLLVRKAISMLTAGDISVREAAYAVGFDNSAYFCRFFKKHTGYTPTEYLKNKG